MLLWPLYSYGPRRSELSPSPSRPVLSGHDYIGHNYIGHNYIGHNYILHPAKHGLADDGVLAEEVAITT